MAAPKFETVVRRTLRPVSDSARERALAAPAKALKTALRTTLNQPGHGRRYGSHVASAPGEPPAPDRGDLRDSVFDRPGNRPGTRHVGAGPHEAAIQLQFGSRSRNLLPRPYMEQALQRARGAMQGAVASLKTSVLR